MGQKQVINRALEIGSLVFLLTPNLVFAWGWLKPLYAVLYTAASIFLAFSYAKWRMKVAADDPESEEESLFSWQTVMACLAVAIPWVALSGIGGFGLQNSDYVKHNAIFSDLLHMDWPVHYGGTIVTDGAPRYLVYALAHYLPAAFLGKFVGWNGANYFLAMWAIFGVTLTLLWVVRTARLNKWYIALLFPFFSGLDFLGHYVTRGALPRMGDHIEWWEGYVQFSANTTMLFWVPQHAIAGWLAAALVAEGIRYKNAMMGVVPFALLAIWSPLVTMGLFPLVAAPMIFPEARGKILPFVVLSAVVVLAFAVPFFAANDMKFPSGIFEGFDPKATNIATLIFFYAIELLVYLVPIFLLLKNLRSADRLLLVVAIACLILFPMYKLGAAHDLAMRGSVGALFVLACFTLRALQDGAKGRLAHQVLIISFAIGSLTAFSEIARSFQFYKHQPPEESAVKGIATLGHDEFVEQYLGREDTLFFKYLAR